MLLLTASKSTNQPYETVFFMYCIKLAISEGRFFGITNVFPHRESGSHGLIMKMSESTTVQRVRVGALCTSFVTHLLVMSRISALYKLRKWAICMIWANNSEFCFLSNFDALKPRIIILMPEMGSMPQYISQK